MALGALGRKVLLQPSKQQEIADRMGEPKSFVSKVVNGRQIPTSPRGWKRYRRVQVAVARAIGLRVDEAFQDYERGVVTLNDRAA